MWKIYCCTFLDGGKLESYEIYHKEYKRRGYAERIARKVYKDFEVRTGRWIGFIISKTNPFTEMSVETYLKKLNDARRFYSNNSAWKEIIANKTNKG